MEIMEKSTLLMNELASKIKETIAEFQSDKPDTIEVEALVSAALSRFLIEKVAENKNVKQSEAARMCSSLFLEMANIRVLAEILFPGEENEKL
jgi:hypothetical protein